MLLEFKTENCLSFKDMTILSFVSTSIKEHKETNVFELDHPKKLKLLKSAAVYGANASGKSNLFKAMHFMKKFVLNSSKETQANEKIRIENFRLNFESFDKPSFFEIIFIVNNNMYRYGFEVNKIEVKSEWLFLLGSREKKLFTRNNNEIIVTSSFSEGKGLEEKTRNNALFLSVVAQFNGKIAGEIIKWFYCFNVISGTLDMKYWHYTAQMLENKKLKNTIIEFIKLADLGIDNIFIDTEELSFEEQTKKGFSKFPNSKLAIYNSNSTFQTLKSVHKKYLDNIFHDQYEIFNFNNESEGTKKIFNLLGVLLDTLQNGKILVIDELDSRLHPLLTREIVKMFHSNLINENNAQILFATHDTNLLDKNIFRRDQIWFTEKDKFGATHLNSLVEYKLNNNQKVRNDASFEKDYILGYYGAIPYLGNFESLIS